MTSSALPLRLRLMPVLTRGAGVLGVALPLLLAVGWAVMPVAALAPWQALVQAPGFAASLRLSVGIALASTALAGLLTLGLVAWWLQRPATGRRGALDVGLGSGLGLGLGLGPMLAVPHAAFALGLLWLLAPAGWLARLLAAPLGWTAPPDWQALQDGWGLSLVLALVLKEVPFLAWNALALLQRPDVATTLRQQLSVGRSLGVTPATLWWTVLWPQWAPRLWWPLLAVLAYGLSVVDVALIIGPGSPPTLAVWAWQALADADPLRQAAGAAAAWLLTALLPLLAALLYGAGWLLQAAAQRHAVAGPARWKAARPGSSWQPGAWGMWSLLRAGLLVMYTAVVLALVWGALAGPWTFPALWPSAWHGPSGPSLAEDLSRMGFTAALGAAVATLALGAAAAWLAATPAHWDRRSAALLMLPLLVPPLLLMVGLYPLALRARLDGTVAGLVWVHTLMALPYALFALAGPWRSLDPRLLTVARLLGHGPWTIAWRVRLPLLLAPLSAAWAVAFAVSVAQFLPTQFIGAGRLTTVTTEAITLASGGQRAPASTQALMQLLLPLLGFAAAAALARRATGLHPTAP